MDGSCGFPTVRPSDGNACHDDSAGKGGRATSSDVPVRPAPLTDWMSAVPDDTPLAAVSMPGTHNSATYSIRSGHWRKVVDALRCQWRSLSEQLNMGIRFLDLRVRSDGRLCHGVVTCAVNIRGAFDELRDFLRHHPTEVLVVRVKDESSSRTSAKGIDAVMMNLVDCAEYPLYLQGRLPSSMREVRGRIILLRDWANGQLGLLWGGVSMNIQDEYWHRTGTKKWKVMKRHLGSTMIACRSAASHGCFPRVLQIHFASTTAIHYSRTPLSLAKIVNAKLVAYLRHAARYGGSVLGIVVMDFPSPMLCDLIIRHNFFSLDPCRPLCSLQRDVVIRDYIENLQCELVASASRADALTNASTEDAFHATQRLGHVFTRLVLEHAAAQLAEPSTDEQPLHSEASSPSKESESSPLPLSTDAAQDNFPRSPQQRSQAIVSHHLGVSPAAAALSTRDGRGFLGLLKHSFARCGWPRSRGDGRTHDEGTTVGDNSRGMGTQHVTSADEEWEAVDSSVWLENLICELVAAASRADVALAKLTSARAAVASDTNASDTRSGASAAVAIGGSCGQVAVAVAEEFNTHVRWVARVFVRVLLESVQAELAVPRGRAGSVQALATASFLRSFAQIAETDTCLDGIHGGSSDSDGMPA